MLDNVWLCSSCCQDLTIQNGHDQAVAVLRKQARQPAPAPHRLTIHSVEFGFMPRVPLISKAVERTEIDMKLGNMLSRRKLTETDFQIQRAELIEGYRDFKEVFKCRQLPRAMRKYVSYQLIWNVLAAHALSMDFCILLDARRPDLLED